MPVVNSAITTRVNHARAGAPAWESFQVSLPTTQLDNTNDQTLLVYWDTDAEVYLTNLRVACSDMDTGTSPALTLNIGVGDVDGTIDTSIISTSTAGQTGASDWPDATAALPVSVSNKYLIVDVGTAADTAAAGTITVATETVRFPDYARTS